MENSENLAAKLRNEAREYVEKILPNQRHSNELPTSVYLSALCELSKCIDAAIRDVRSELLKELKEEDSVYLKLGQKFVRDGVVLKTSVSYKYPFEHKLVWQQQMKLVKEAERSLKAEKIALSAVEQKLVASGDVKATEVINVVSYLGIEEDEQ